MCVRALDPPLSAASRIQVNLHTTDLSLHIWRYNRLGMTRFEWDPVKAQSNLRKHGVLFEDAMLVFEDPNAILEPERIDETGELRWRALGLARGTAVLMVAHVIRQDSGGEVVRPISARRADRKERNRYE